ncbi:MAG: hypothetical protein M3P30_03220 [Chloroflexota bacterium]|nr:hypothetical protein [Chloroflexota bacterium]
MSRSFEKLVSRRAMMRGTLTATAGLGAMVVVGCGEDSRPQAGSSTATALPATTATNTPPTAQTAAMWTQLPAGGGPSPRRDHSMTLDPASGLVYLFGGRRAGVSMNDLWTFDPKTMTWREIAVTGEKPPARFAQVALFDAGPKRLIITTGQGDGSIFFNDVWAFDPSSAAWTKLGTRASERPEIRYGAGGAHDAAGDRIFVSHGFTDRGRFDDTWSFDLTAETWTKLATKGAVPIKRCLTRCIWLADRGELLLFGGQTDATPFLGDFWSLNVAAAKWSEKKLSVLPGARNLYGSSFEGARWYIFGGNTADGPTAETWMFDIAGDVWAQVGASSAPPARYSSDAAIAGARMYAFGGHDGTTELGDAWALKLAG